MNKEIVLIGYGGHGLVVAETLLLSGHKLAGYCDHAKKESNPFNLPFLGSEKHFFTDQGNVEKYAAFIAIGDQKLRKLIFNLLTLQQVEFVNAIHPSAVVSPTTALGKGILIAANASINPCCTIGDGAICNTSCSIDHECTIGSFAHICPGTVLCGNVNIGADCVIGANSVIIPGKKVNDQIIVGAGSTVVKDLVEKGTYVGTPVKLL